MVTVERMREDDSSEESSSEFCSKGGQAYNLNCHGKINALQHLQPESADQASDSLTNQIKF
ncbi:hypothetical protein PCCS19_15660 [Paenibacillus sp. CCS19]|nr:hypothetical protein PCCS19_15660 [Paenibacillus cellulosilyticus]